MVPMSENEPKKIYDFLFLILMTGTKLKSAIHTTNAFFAHAKPKTHDNNDTARYTVIT